MSKTASNLTQFTTHEDEVFGYTIQYPSSWNLTQDSSLNKVVDFSPPDDGVNISVRVLPRTDNETLKDRDNEIKNNSDFGPTLRQFLWSPYLKQFSFYFLFIELSPIL
jgi:hypothetical protein